ncbi:3-hydroxyacyl-CoA dehydrogenase type-2-like isoform X1 [Thrips palmi]|uniref:3-hydroxyacyl-CoA dehydrogenase type-2-like isoform X1 n=1 Tax=Thrips palmi TaxID=161013 RepID=A0A6P8ZWF6_THRPL|nr:3-hydroxyacyl-CoA dehydrogenase type-2-like isoform X1 [Thrips palmi]
MLKNMVAVVTGAVNGLGRQTLAHFCKENACVFGCDIRDDNGELGKTFGSSVAFLKADVRSEDDMQDVFNQARERFGKVDILVNCAGYSAAFLTITAAGKVFELETFQRLLEVNITGQFNASRLAAVEMAKNKPTEDGDRGVIILTSGFTASSPRRGHAGISACHGGINSMTLPMARDLGPLGIRVATISPGLFATPLTSSIPDDIKEFLEFCQAFPHRFGEPIEYSDLALHIIKNKMINGEVLSIDGGLSLPAK